MLKFTPVFFLLLSYNIVWTQPERRLLKGKVNSELTDLDGIYVRNLNSDEATNTTEGGYFSLMAKAGDSLMFSSVQFKGRQVALTEEDFNVALFFVRVEGIVNAIDEVKIIRYNNINAVSLGIIPKGQKKYTPAERRLKAASSLDGQIGLSSSMSIDPLLNWMSGRTAMLKKELAVEKREFLLAKIAQMFEEEYFTQTLKIPFLYVRGFWYYAIEDKKFIDALNSKNKFMATFLLGEMAASYRTTINEE